METSEDAEGGGGESEDEMEAGAVVAAAAAACGPRGDGVEECKKRDGKERGAEECRKPDQPAGLEQARMRADVILVGETDGRCTTTGYRSTRFSFTCDAARLCDGEHTLPHSQPHRSRSVTVGAWERGSGGAGERGSGGARTLRRFKLVTCESLHSIVRSAFGPVPSSTCSISAATLVTIRRLSSHPCLSMAAEEIKLGEVDPVDEFCVISIFDEAAAYLSDAHHIKLSSDQKLQFYAYFKQATIGPCDKPQPGLFEMVERAKWKAWKALGRMSKDEAVTQYVRLLDKIAPQWKEELGDMEDEDEEERKKRKAKGQEKDDGGLDIAPAVSRPVHEPDNQPITADLCHFAAEGDLKQLQSLLAAGTSLTFTNPQHQSALHLAVDRGNEAVVDLLLNTARERRQLADVLAQQDEDGMTALHYACVCEQEGCAVRLVEAGADPKAVNNEGETCWDAASEKMQHVMRKAQEKQKRQ